MADVLAAHAYGAAYNEALAYLGARLVDPASDSSPRGYALAADDRHRARGLRPAEIGRARAVDRSASALRGLGPLDLPARSSRGCAARGRMRRALARDLGHRLGRVLYERVRAAASTAGAALALLASAPAAACAAARAALLRDRSAD